MVLVGLVIIITGTISSLGTRERTQIDFPKPMPLKEAVRITFSSNPFVFLVATVLFYGIGQYFAVSFGAYLIIFILYDGDKVICAANFEACFKIPSRNNRALLKYPV